MARKSRKNKNLIEIAEVEQPIVFTNRIPTALYARLSEENNGYETTDSINTQIKLVEEFINSQTDLKLIDSFIDNGFTGTNFDRPEFIRMMERVKTGEIRCIVVKDLSRFGRDYLETGYYIETIFPLLGVRLIAVTDNFDTARQSDRDSLMIPIKNMVNAMYAKDVSRKQTAAFELKQQLGIPNLTFAPYGYKYDEEKNTLVLDEEIKPYLRMMFSWTLIGVKRSEIAKRLKIMGVPTPLDAAKKQGVYLSKPANSWNAYTVRDLLHNPIYSGRCVLGKTKQSLYKGIKPTRNPREEWIYFDDVFEAVISKEEYDQISEKIIKNRDYRNKRIEENEGKREGLYDCFPGMIYCGECNKPMPYQRGSHKRNGEEPSFSYYRCITNERSKRCNNHRILQNYLKLVTMDSVKNLIKNMCNNRDILMKIQKDELKSNSLRLIRRDITGKHGKQVELENRKATLYADFCEGLIDEEDYQFLKEKTILEIQQNNEAIRIAEEKLLETQKVIRNYIEKTNKLEKYLELDTFNEELVRSLISEIRIYRDRRIKITFKIEDMIENAVIQKCLTGTEEVEK